MHFIIIFVIRPLRNNTFTSHNSTYDRELKHLQVQTHVQALTFVYIVAICVPPLFKTNYFVWTNMLNELVSKWFLYLNARYGPFVLNQNFFFKKQPCHDICFKIMCCKHVPKINKQRLVFVLSTNTINAIR